MSQHYLMFHHKGKEEHKGIFEILDLRLLRII